MDLLRILKICDGRRVLTPDHSADLRRGEAPTVMHVPYTGQIGKEGYIVPLAEVRQSDTEVANLELLRAHSSFP